MSDAAIFQVLGAVVMAVGVALFIYDKREGSNALKAAGVEVSLSTPSLIIFVIGAGLFCFPFTAAFRDRSKEMGRETPVNQNNADAISNETEPAPTSSPSSNSTQPASSKPEKGADQHRQVIHSGQGSELSKPSPSELAPATARRENVSTKIASASKVTPENADAKEHSASPVGNPLDVLPVRKATSQASQSPPINLPHVRRGWELTGEEALGEKNWNIIIRRCDESEERATFIGSAISRNVKMGEYSNKEISDLSLRTNTIGYFGIDNKIAAVQLQRVLERETTFRFKVSRIDISSAGSSPSTSLFVWLVGPNCPLPE